MTTATTTRPFIDTRSAATTTVAISDLRRAMRLAVAATADLSLDGGVWAELVPCVDELERVLGQAIGVPTSPSSGSAHAPRIGALVMAARRVMRRDTGIVDGAAAGRATELAQVIARAGVTGIAPAHR